MRETKRSMRSEDRRVRKRKTAEKRRRMGLGTVRPRTIRPFIVKKFCIKNTESQIIS